MPASFPSATDPQRAAIVLAEAMRRVDASISGPVDLDALRRALETEMEKGPRTLVALMKVGRRRALDCIGRRVRREAIQHGLTPM